MPSKVTTSEGAIFDDKHQQFQTSPAKCHSDRPRSRVVAVEDIQGHARHCPECCSTRPKPVHHRVAACLTGSTFPWGICPAATREVTEENEKHGNEEVLALKLPLLILQWPLFLPESPQ